MVKVMGALVAGLIAGTTVAAPPPVQWLTSDLGDPYGTASIQQGRYDAVQKRLTNAYARGSRETELLLNLAAVNARGGKPGTAQDLYREVLKQPNISLVTLSGTSWSHEIAQRGLAGTMTASR